MWNLHGRFRLRTRLVDQFELDVSAVIRPDPSSAVFRPRFCLPSPLPIWKEGPGE